MAEVLNVFTRRTKAYYEAIYNSLMPGKIGIDDFLFNVRDDDADSANFALDELIRNPHGVSFRKRGEQAAVRPYVPGVGNIYEVVRTSEKTGISETLRDSVIVGGEETEGLSSRNARLLSQIVKDHTVGHAVTRWKLAIDVIRTGKYSPMGLGGNDIGEEIDFGRDATLTVTYDFTAVGATFDAALQELYDPYRAKNGSGDELVMIMGEDWLANFEDDTKVQTWMQSNSANVLIEQNLIAPELKNVQGLKIVARYRIPGRTDWVTICTYKPQAQFIQYSGATSEAFFPSDEAVLFSMASVRYKVRRGIDVLDDSGRAQRAMGDVVFDQYTDKDPVQTWLRSGARYAFIPADVDHTAQSTGTFSTS